MDLPPLDAVDLRLLDLLQTDASRSNQELAKAAGVSPATSFRRVRRLVETGVIERRIALLSHRIGLVAIVALFFFLGMNAYQKRVQNAQDVQVKAEQTRLIRMHSPVFGPQSAPVTIVEFFDPACETCRAFYPIVKSLMAKYPNDVRLVIRYAPFHQGSDQVVKLLADNSAKPDGFKACYKPNES